MLNVWTQAAAEGLYLNKIHYKAGKRCNQELSEQRISKQDRECEQTFDASFQSSTGFDIQHHRLISAGIIKVLCNAPVTQNMKTTQWNNYGSDSSPATAGGNKLGVSTTKMLPYKHLHLSKLRDRDDFSPQRWWALGGPAQLAIVPHNPTYMNWLINDMHFCVWTKNL